MDEKKEALLKAVKHAVSKYGISSISTRIIAELAGVNDANIYYYFHNKEDLLLQAYQRESGNIFRIILKEIDSNHNLPISFTEKARKSFNATWKYLLSDKERLYFCVSYYHSNFFESALDYHNSQLTELTNRLSGYFNSIDDCKHTLYSMCSVLYDSANSVAKSRIEYKSDFDLKVFKTEIAILTSQIRCTDDINVPQLLKVQNMTQ